MVESDIDKLIRETKERLEKEEAEPKPKVTKIKEKKKVEKTSKPKKVTQKAKSKPRPHRPKKCSITIDGYKKEIKEPIEISLIFKGDLRVLINKHLEKVSLKPNIDLEKLIAFVKTKSEKDDYWGRLRKRLVPAKKGASRRSSAYIEPTLRAVNKHYDEIKSDSERFDIEHIINLVLQSVKEFLVSELGK